MVNNRGFTTNTLKKIQLRRLRWHHGVTSIRISPSRNQLSNFPTPGLPGLPLICNWKTKATIETLGMVHLWHHETFLPKIPWVKRRCGEAAVLDGCSYPKWWFYLGPRGLFHNESMENREVARHRHESGGKTSVEEYQWLPNMGISPAIGNPKVAWMVSITRNGF